MFTGIVEELGQIKNIIRGSEWLNVFISCSTVLESTKVGDSIAVNGVCLTVTNINKGYFKALVMPETFRKTSLANSSVGTQVNLERAMKLTDRFGGHIVTGHIDGVGIIKEINREQKAISINIEADEDILRYIVLKGSVTIDGISLTVSDVDKTWFKVYIIPHTQNNTILVYKKIGDVVNIECDVIGKYIEKFLVGVPNLNNNNITFDYLRKQGFS